MALPLHQFVQSSPNEVGSQKGIAQIGAQIIPIERCWLSIDKAEPPNAHERRPRFNAETLLEVRCSGPNLRLKDLRCRCETSREKIFVEAGHPRGCTDHFGLSHKRACTMAAKEETILGKLMQSLANGHARNVVLGSKNFFGGQAITRSQFPLEDLLTDLFGDLDIGWDPSGALDHKTLRLLII
jgi:hypothetical protein